MQVIGCSVIETRECGDRCPSTGMLTRHQGGEQEEGALRGGVVDETRGKRQEQQLRARGQQRLRKFGNHRLQRPHRRQTSRLMLVCQVDEQEVQVAVEALLADRVVKQELEQDLRCQGTS